MGEFYRQLIAVKSAPTRALDNGAWGGRMIEVKTSDREEVLAFARSTSDDAVLAIFNLSASPREVELLSGPFEGSWRPIPWWASAKRPAATSSISPPAPPSRSQRGAGPRTSAPKHPRSFPTVYPHVCGPSSGGPHTFSQSFHPVPQGLHVRRCPALGCGSRERAPAAPSSSAIAAACCIRPRAARTGRQDAGARPGD